MIVRVRTGVYMGRDSQVTGLKRQKAGLADFLCVDDVDGRFGAGNLNEIATASCARDEVGEKTAVCKQSGKWEDIEDNCVLGPLQELFNQSQDILLTAGILTIDGARNSWDTLNTRATNTLTKRMNIPEAFSASSAFLESIENITSSLINDSFAIETDFILLNKTTFTDTFNGDFNSSVEIDIPEADGGNESITVITFSSMDNVLPARDELNSSSNVINGRVVLVQSKASISNISFTFDVINDALGNPQCVFWNFSLFNGLGGFLHIGVWNTAGQEGPVSDSYKFTDIQWWHEEHKWWNIIFKWTGFFPELQKRKRYSSNSERKIHFQTSVYWLYGSVC
ncbi:hypothetical protein INR49_004370 [Caranx melampygus]|nr:hypothetical protein INR49_004370 [Caranx melampygus]